MQNNALWIILQRLRIPFIVIIVTYAIAILGMILIPGLDDKGEVYYLTFFDAFYFISYTASTIGFGETPYTFTYSQRLWVLVCIYLTVVGWLYAIGALISIISDKRLKIELMKGKFKRRIRGLDTEFVIVLGYNYVNSIIIKKLIDSGLDVVLIEHNEDRRNDFSLEDYAATVPVLIANALSSKSLKESGIEKKNCKAVVAHFYKEDKNLRIAILTKILNSKVKVISKATKPDIMISLFDTDITRVINPFEIFAKRFDMALSSPHILLLENWIYKNSDLSDATISLPKEKYIICGHGRFGKSLEVKLKKHNLEYVIIDELGSINQNIKHKEKYIQANADDKDTLLKAGITTASVLVAGTQNDISNMSIILTARKLNPNIYIIARENTMDEINIFKASGSNWLFMLEQILINKTCLCLAHPLKHSFLKQIFYQDNTWAISLIDKLKSQLGDNPKMLSLKITKECAYAIFCSLQKGQEISLNILLKSLSNWKKENRAIPLLLKRKNKEILLPHNQSLEIGDNILFACDKESKAEIELIASNIYELHYVCSGKEQKNSFLKLFD